LEAKNKEREGSNKRTVNSKAVLLVYPSRFSMPRLEDLISDIKLAFRAKKVGFRNIVLEDDLMVFEMDDVVEGAAVASKRFGVEKVAIARKMPITNFTQISSTIVSVGKLKVLPREKFFIKAQISKNARVNYNSRDLEFASTGDLLSALRSGSSRSRSNKFSQYSATYPSPAKNEKEADRTLDVYIGKISSYVCIETDKGLGGLPFGSQKVKVLCAWYDPLSCFSCVSMLKCGFLPEIVVLYTDDESLRQNLKLLGSVVNKLKTRKYSISLARLKLPRSGLPKPWQMQHLGQQLRRVERPTSRQRQRLELQHRGVKRQLAEELENENRRIVRGRGGGEEEEGEGQEGGIEERMDAREHQQKIGHHEAILKCLAAIRVLSQMNGRDVVLPFSTAVHPTWLIESSFKQIIALNKVPWMPLLFPIQDVHEISRDLGMDEYNTLMLLNKFWNEAESISTFTAQDLRRYSRVIDKLSQEVMNDMKYISFEVGPNYLHNILDSI